MSSSLTSKDDVTPPEIKELSVKDPQSSISTQGEIPVLPLEVLHQTLDQLSNVVDLANVALVCREWREIVNSCDACWEKSFCRNYTRYNADNYASLPTWRQRYIACTLDLTCLELRDARHEFGTVSDNIDSMQIALQDNEYDLEMAEADGEIKKISTLKRNIARYEKAIEEYYEVLEEVEEMVTVLEKKRHSLQAATKYRPTYE